MKILEEARIKDCNLVHTPMESGLQLSKSQHEEGINGTGYMKKVGCLRYLVHARPDLSFCVEVLS